MHTGLKGVVDTLETEQQRRLRTTVFLRNDLPWWVSVCGYIGLAVLSIIVIPILYPPVPVCSLEVLVTTATQLGIHASSCMLLLYPLMSTIVNSLSFILMSTLSFILTHSCPPTQQQRYFILIGFLVGPIFAAANAYCAGLTDWNIASLYGKLDIFVFAAWGGSNGGVTSGLVMCGIMFACAGAGADLMQDLKTGYLTLSSSTSMFVAQVLGCLGGVVISPSVFQLFYTAFPLGVPGTAYPAPFADVFRSLVHEVRCCVYHWWSVGVFLRTLYSESHCIFVS